MIARPSQGTFKNGPPQAGRSGGRGALEPDGDALLRGSGDGEGLDCERGAQQPGPYTGRQGGRRAEHAETGDGGVGVQLADRGIRSEDEVRLAKVAPPVAGKATRAPTTRSSVAMCLIRVPAPTQGGCHARPREGPLVSH